MKWLVRILALLWPLAAAHAGCNLGALPFQLQNGTVADANQVMANFNAILSGAQSNCAELGVNTSITALAGLSSPLTPSLGGSATFIAGPVSGSANAIVAPIQSPGAGFALINGYQVIFSPTAANTGPASLNFAGTSPVTIVKRVGASYVALSGGELTAFAPVTVTYDAANNVYAIATPNGSVSSGGTGQQFLPPGVLLGNGSSPIISQLPLAISNGGTGATSMPAGVVATNGNAMSALLPLPIAYGGTNTQNPGSGPVIANGATLGFTVSNPLSPSYGGTGVTNVSWPLPVGFGGTGIGSGVSGGVLGFTASGTLASSPTLAGAALVVGGGPGGLPTTLGSLGTTATVLHGNASGSPAFSPVNLTTDVTGVLPIANGGTGQTIATGPTVQVFTAPGPATYTPTAGALWIKVRMVGGGGGGAGTGGVGGTGGTTSLATITAIGGGGGANSGTNPAGGAGGTGGAGGVQVRIPGLAAPSGVSASITSGVQINWIGTAGRSTPLGSYGAGGIGGTSSATTGAVLQMAGGGSGEYVEFYAAANTYSITVGAAGTAGTTGGPTAGGPGAIIIEEYTH